MAAAAAPPTPTATRPNWQELEHTTFAEEDAELAANDREGDIKNKPRAKSLSEHANELRQNRLQHQHQVPTTQGGPVVVQAPQQQQQQQQINLPSAASSSPSKRTTTTTGALSGGVEGAFAYGVSLCFASLITRMSYFYFKGPPIVITSGLNGGSGNPSPNTTVTSASSSSASSSTSLLYSSHPLRRGSAPLLSVRHINSKESAALSAAGGGGGGSPSSCSPLPSPSSFYTTGGNVWPFGPSFSENNAAAASSAPGPLSISPRMPPSTSAPTTPIGLVPPTPTSSTSTESPAHHAASSQQWLKQVAHARSSSNPLNDLASATTPPPSAGAGLDGGNTPMAKISTFIRKSTKTVVRKMARSQSVPNVHAIEDITPFSSGLNSAGSTNGSTNGSSSNGSGGGGGDDTTKYANGLASPFSASSPSLNTVGATLASPKLRALGASSPSKSSARWDSPNDQQPPVEQAYRMHRVYSSPQIWGGRTPGQFGPSVGPDDFRLVRMLGKGDVGRVFLVNLKGTKKLYAMKVLFKEEMLRRKKVRFVVVEYF